jgi:hypothetical protein
MIVNFEWITGKVSFFQVFSHPLVILGEARAASMSVFLGIILWVGYRSILKIKKNNVKKIIVSVVLVVLFVTFISSIVSLARPDGKLRTEFETLSGGGRPLLWGIAGQAIAEHLFLGTGPDNFDVAFIRHFDNRLFLPQYNEVWFDRAHNIFVDTLVDMGILGLLAYLSLFGTAIYMVWRVAKREDEQSINIAIIATMGLTLHLLDIQTAFDTVISYLTLGALFAFINGYYWSKRDGKKINSSRTISIIVSVVLILASIIGIRYTLKIRSANIANHDARTIGSSDGRLAIYPKLLGSPVDQATYLWRTTTDIEQSIVKKPELINSPEKIKGLLSEFAYLEDRYKQYINKNPNDYRMLLNLAKNMIFVSILGKDELNDSKQYIDRASAIVPQSPIPDIMRSIISVYSGNFRDAYKYINKAKSIIPDLQYTLGIEGWIKIQEKSFPQIDFITVQYI